MIKYWIYWLLDKGYLTCDYDVQRRAFTTTVYTPAASFYTFLAGLESCMRDVRIDR
jgi:hypothetical protein